MTNHKAKAELAAPSNQVGKINMTSKQRKRRSFLIAELSRMSWDWGRFTGADWEPLEAELRQLDQGDA